MAWRSDSNQFDIILAVELPRGKRLFYCAYCAWYTVLGALNPKPQTPNPKPLDPKPQAQTLNLKP
jgi:hypothetical protein